MYVTQKRIGDYFRSLGARAIRWRYVILGTTLLVTGICAWHLPGLRIATSIESQFMTYSGALGEYQTFRDRFGRDEKIVLLVEAEEVFSVGFLATLAQFHHDLEASVPLVKRVRSLTNARYTERADDGIRISRFLDALPATPAEADALELRARDYPLYRDLYLSRDLTSTIVVIETRSLSALSEDGKRIRNYGRGVAENVGVSAVDNATDERRQSISQVENIALLSLLETVVREYNAPDFRISFTGTPVYQYHVEPMIRDNIKRICLLVLVSSALFMGLLFGRASGVVVPLLVVLASLTVVTGTMAMLSVPFALSSAMLASILLSVGLTAPIHYLVVFFKYQRRVGKYRAILMSLAHSGFPILMTALTTMAGFLSLAFSDIAPLVHLGVFTALGVLTSLLLTLFALPAILSIMQVVWGSLDRDLAYEESVFKRALAGLGRLGAQRRRLVIGAWVVVAILAVGGITQVRFSHDLLHFFAEDSEFRREANRIEDETRGFRALEVVVDTGRDGGVTEHHVLARLEELERSLVSARDPAGTRYVGKTISTASFVKELNQALHGGDPAYYTVPEDSRDILGLLHSAGEQAPGEFAEFTDPAFRLARSTAMMYWRDAATDVDFIERAREQARTVFSDVAETIVTGAVSIDASVIKSMMRTLILCYMTAVLLIAVLMVIAVGDLRLGLLAMIPNLLPIAVGLGAMGYLDVSMNTYTLIGGTIVLGIAVDDTVHFFHVFHKYYTRSGSVEAAVKNTLDTTGRALLSTSMILCVAFFLRLFSELQVIADFGLVVGISLLVAFLADVLLAPALLSLLYERGSPASIAQAEPA